MNITAMPAGNLFPNDIIAPGAFMVVASTPSVNLPGFTEVEVVDVLDKSVTITALFPANEYVEIMQVA